MVVPESSHDRSCSKEPLKNVTSTITIPESEVKVMKAYLGLTVGAVVCCEHIVFVIEFVVWGKANAFRVPRRMINWHAGNIGVHAAYKLPHRLWGPEEATG